MRKFAIIVAAGSGTRMGSATPKQFLHLMGKPILWYSIKAFLDSFSDIGIIVVLPAAYLGDADQLLGSSGSAAKIQWVAGGETRFDSVKNGLALVEDPSVVFIHDGVRCLVSKKLIIKCYEETLRSGSAVPAVDSKDSVRLLHADGTNEVVNRSRVKFLQTPQTFLSSLILPAYNRSFEPQFTDEATVLEASGTKPNLIEGEHSNIKITTPMDLVVAEHLMRF